MKATGIIAEYNPFHNGHAYQIQKAKADSGADVVCVALSGNFVQRGAPALLDKFSRVRMALENGADFVFEIPTLFATASAEYFAAAGIALFTSLGCIDFVSFGCETPNLSLLTKTARLLLKEPEAYSRLLRSYVKQGLSFPLARARAAASFFQQTGADDACDLPVLLPDAPNNILALEYIKALLRSRSSIRPLPIERVGSRYHDADCTGAYASASALRKLLLASDSAQTDQRMLLARYVPERAASLLLSPDTHFLTEDDFSDMLFYRLLSEQGGGFSEYADVSSDLSNRIVHALPSFTGFADFCKALKSKDVTYARISRMLLHILLDIRQTDLECAKASGYIPYLRLLGFRRQSAGLLKEFQQSAGIPLIVRPAKDGKRLTGMAKRLFDLDASSSNLYYGALALKCKTPQKHEFLRQCVIL